MGRRPGSGMTDHVEDELNGGEVWYEAFIPFFPIHYGGHPYRFNKDGKFKLWGYQVDFIKSMDNMCRRLPNKLWRADKRPDGVTIVRNPQIDPELCNSSELYQFIKQHDPTIDEVMRKRNLDEYQLRALAYEHLLNPKSYAQTQHPPSEHAGA